MARVNKKVRVEIAAIEDNPLRFIGLRTLLEAERDFAISCAASDDTVALQDKDVVLIAETTGKDLLSVIDKLRAQQPQIRVIVTGTIADDDSVLRAIAGGAKGYINESASASEFARAIRIVNQGLVWASRRAISKLIDQSADSVQRQFLSDPITAREREVLEMLVAGKSNKEIAIPLGIEERTVKSHVAKLMRKLGVENRVKLSIHAITHALVVAK